MDLGLTHKVAFVAASSQGLGKAAAISLAKEGVKLAICSRDIGKLNFAAEEIRTLTGVQVLPIACDVTLPDDIERAVNATLHHYGRIDILVNNAGGPPAGKISKVTDHEWESGFELTMMSMIRMTRAVLPSMERQKWGRVISIVSLSARQPIDELLISSTLRPGILGLTKVLANQYGIHGITVNSVCPGYFLTQRQRDLGVARSKERNISMEEYLKESAQNIPVGRLGRPEELGDVIAFLASERASFINGESILVDGGQAKGL